MCRSLGFLARLVLQCLTIPVPLLETRFLILSKLLNLLRNGCAERIEVVVDRRLEGGEIDRRGSVIQEMLKGMLV